MANRQTSSSSSQKAAAKAKVRSGASRTVERDEHYDVISVLYHALKGAQTIERYIEDAREAEDEELVAFFEETRAEYAERAAQAKQLLAARLEGADEGSEELEEEEEEEEEEEDDD